MTDAAVAFTANRPRNSRSVGTWLVEGEGAR